MVCAHKQALKRNQDAEMRWPVIVLKITLSRPRCRGITSFLVLWCKGAKGRILIGREWRLLSANLLRLCGDVDYWE